MGVALLGVALLLGACAPAPAHDATVVSRLDDMLADESAVNAIMGPPPLAATHTYRALERWPARVFLLARGLPGGQRKRDGVGVPGQPQRRGARDDVHQRSDRHRGRRGGGGLRHRRTRP